MKKSYLEVEKDYLIYANEDLSLERAIELAQEMFETLYETTDFYRMWNEYYFSFKDYVLNVWRYANTIGMCLYHIVEEGNVDLNNIVWESSLPEYEEDEGAQ